MCTQYRILVFGLISCLAVGNVSAQKSRRSLPLSELPHMVDVATLVNDLQVALIYATPDNFTGKVLYKNLDACYLHRDAAGMVAKAAKFLAQRRPDLHLLAYDCLRPRSAQWEMWKVVKGTPQQRYVANPASRIGSIHNYGCAIDLTLATKDGKPVDMGTPFDFFGHKAQPRHEKRMLTEGRLTHVQVANRLLLREIMIRAGFFPISNEWWHFNCATPRMTFRKYKIVE